MGNARTYLHVDGQIEYSRYQGYALHLVGLARCGVSNAIVAFEPSIKRETATVPRDTRQSYPPVWQCSATCRKTGQEKLRNAEMAGIIPSTVLSKSCSFRLSFVSIVGTRPGGSSTFPLLWRSKKMDRFVDHLKRRIVFSRWYPKIARKIEKK